MAGVSFDSLISSCLQWSFFYWFSCLAGFAMLSYKMANFGSLVLGFLGWEKFLSVVIPLVCIFKALLLKKQ